MAGKRANDQNGVNECLGVTGDHVRTKFRMREQYVHMPDNDTFNFHLWLGIRYILNCVLVRTKLNTKSVSLANSIRVSFNN